MALILFIDHGVLSCPCINRTANNLQKVTYASLLSAAVATSGLAFLATVDFKDAIGILS